MSVDHILIKINTECEIMSIGRVPFLFSFSFFLHLEFRVSYTYILLKKKKKKTYVMSSDSTWVPVNFKYLPVATQVYIYIYLYIFIYILAILFFKIILYPLTISLILLWECYRYNFFYNISTNGWSSKFLLVRIWTHHLYHFFTYQ